MKLNFRTQSNIRTHEGAPARRINAEQELRRSLMACLLWEKTFYEDGEDIATRIAGLVPLVPPHKVYGMAIEAREDMNLRHAPLLVAREMARHESHRRWVGALLGRIIQRADELAEFLAIYWKDGKQPLAAQVKRGLADAFLKFDEYQLAKYNRKEAIKLRDVMFLVHPKPQNREQAELFRKLANNELSTPDTWEVALSANDNIGAQEKWTRLLSENRLGAMALLRNLRNMLNVRVDEDLIESSLSDIYAKRVLPFRFIAAARYAPRFEAVLEQKMLESVQDQSLAGRTVFLIDVSYSMNRALSGKSDMNRMDAACGLAMVGREVCEKTMVFTFSNKIVEVAARRGFALRDAIVNSQQHSGTYLGQAIAHLVGEYAPQFDRLIVITDEQSHDAVAVNLNGRKAYLINVATYQNGVGYGGDWVHLDGWSDTILKYIIAYEG